MPGLEWTVGGGGTGRNWMELGWDEVCSFLFWFGLVRHGDGVTLPSFSRDDWKGRGDGKDGCIHVCVHSLISFSFQCVCIVGNVLVSYGVGNPGRK